MSTSLKPLIVKLSVCAVAVPLPVLLPWLQLHTVGKLVIQSTPSGANISINGKSMGQTPASFVVSLGTYSVTVTGAELNCPSRVVGVTPGSTVTLTCTSSGWQ
jgi:PEGA domain